MKKIFFIGLFMPLASFAQTPIGIYWFSNSTGVNQDNYSVVTAGPNLDESISGANSSWNFAPISLQTVSHTTAKLATEAQREEYPGTALVIETRTEVAGSDDDIMTYYMGDTPIMETLLAGVESPGMNLKYTDNLYIGEFALSYGHTVDSDVSGTFDINGITGTFTGTANAAVDANGILIINEDGTDNLGATRLKIVQELQLFSNNISTGTLTYTMYYYYSIFSPSAGALARSTYATLDIPSLDISESNSKHEFYTNSTLGIDALALRDSLSIAPNPVNDVLHIAGSDDITAITVVDAAGRTVLQSTGNDVSVSHLSSGIYYVSATAGNAVKTLKMVKQ